MKYLFVIAMKKEAGDIINHYKLDKIDDNYYKKDNLELIITDVSRNGITSALVNLIYKYNINYKDYTVINIGMVGSNNLKVGEVVMATKSLGYHFDLTPFGDPLYHALNSPFNLEKIDNIKEATCYTSDGFVLETNIKEDAIFDMELNAIVNFPFKKYYSIKVVSDSLNNKEYNNFNYKEALIKIIKVIDKII
ncbi:MAG: hypothetical protein MR296_03070 [Tenericutes bacterium]|nr:hypothetical protein [Mycoplasmatota bacterium]